MRFLNVAAAAVLLSVSVCCPARADVPYDGWRRQAPPPAYTGSPYPQGEPRAFDGSPRQPAYSRAYGAPPAADPGYGYSQPYAGRPAIWSGLYIGGQIGGVWNSASLSGPAPESISGTGWGLGGHVGYNLQIDHIVTGLELDADWTNAGATSGLSGLATITPQTNWLSSGRVRLGYAFDNGVLLYGTGGLAMSGNSVGYQVVGFTGSTDQVLLGYVVGGGAELKLSPSFSARVEALHYGFGAVDAAVPLIGNVKTNLEETTVRVGLSYHLN